MREMLGLPADWESVARWIKKPFIFGYPTQPIYEKKTTEWDNMDFSKKAPAEFWKKFPSRPLPECPQTRVNIDALKSLVAEASGHFNMHQKDAAAETIGNLAEGAPAYQSVFLKGGLMRNAFSVQRHGATFTKVLQGWISEGFVAGPFKSPPVSEFRSNSLMAVEQKGKIRPILNMSFPEGDSFNDNVDEAYVTKVRMSSAKQFGQAVLRAGRGALMTKMDMKDAYKHVPARPVDFRLQGFKWLGAYFVETQQIFGASTAVANFDNMAATILDLAMTKCDIPRSFVHRTLDDTACVAPEGTEWCQQFSETYKEVCKEVNIRLAEDCPHQEKAFTNKTRGTVLGIQFDTVKLSWRISTDKATEILTDIHTAVNSGHLDLKQVEEMAGRLCNFGQMCPFLQAFKRPLNDLLASFKEDYSILMPVSEDLIRDLRVWAAVVSSACRWLPIHHELSRPPSDAVHFVSDAAGGHGAEEWVGVASLGLKEDGSIWFICRGQWPKAILEDSDEKGVRFASKMTTLELVGLLLPLLTVPDHVRQRNVVLGVDNVSVVFGWENRSVSGDMSASVLIRAMHIVASFLETRIFVQHVPRRSSLASIVADDMTRASTATAEVWETLRSAYHYDPPEPLWDWLSNPSADWQLGQRLVGWIQSKE